MVVSPRDPICLVGSPLERLRGDTLEGGATGERGLASEAPFISCRSAAGLLAATPRETPVSGRDRHLAAVARSFGWAEEAAARGDYADALSWIQVVEAIGDLIPIEYQTKRRTWLSALDKGRARNEARRDRLDIRPETSVGSRSQPQARRGTTALSRLRPSPTTAWAAGTAIRRQA
jgi:hypothetical protein